MGSKTSKCPSNMKSSKGPSNMESSKCPSNMESSKGPSNMESSKGPSNMESGKGLSNMESIKIFEALYRNNLEKVKKLIEDKSDLSTIVRNGKTLAHIAVTKGYLDTLKYLLEKDISLLTIEYVGKKLEGPCTLLDLAVESGHLEIVKYLVEKHNADIYEIFHNRYTAINWAIYNDRLNIIKYFIEERNVDINKPPVKGAALSSSAFRPLLFDAVEYNSGDIINYLMEEKKADLTLVDGKRENILYAALRTGNLNFIKYILDAKKIKIDINWKNDKGYTLVHLAITTPLIQNPKKILRYLIDEKHAQFDIPAGEEGRTPLHCAAEKKSLEITKYLIECGADISKQDINGDTALHLALVESFGHGLEICEYLCENGANVNQKNKNHESPMDIAINKLSEEDEMVEACALFLKHGANVNATDKKGNYLTHLAAMRNKISFLDYLASDRWIDVNTPRKTDYWTPLHCAAFHSHYEICQSLLKHGANIGQKNKRGETPFDIAVMRLTKEEKFDRENEQTAQICELFIEHGANPKSTDKAGNQLVHIAAMQNRIYFLDYLGRDKHVDINTPRETDHWTPLHCAAYLDHFEICKYLILHGADTQAKSIRGQTPAQVAFDQNLIDYIENATTTRRNRRSVHNHFPAPYQSRTYQEYAYQRMTGPSNRNGLNFFSNCSIFGLRDFFFGMSLLMSYFVKNSITFRQTIVTGMDPVAENACNYFSNFTDAALELN